MGRKVCRTPGCPTIINADAYRGLCDDCRRAWNQARGTRTERGYTAAYDRERAAWAQRIAAGETVLCWRCHKPVGPDFHLGHNDDRTRINGPEHPLCNLSAAGKAAHT